MNSWQSDFTGKFQSNDFFKFPKFQTISPTVIIEIIKSNVRSVDVYTHTSCPELTKCD